MSAAASALPEPKLTRAEWEQQSWEENNKKQLRKWRNLEIAAGVPHNRYEATPRACWLVEQAHSTNQQKVFMALKAAEKFERPESRCLTRISSITINGDPLHRLVHISLGTLSWLIKQMFGTAMPISTLRRCLKRLAEKHSIIIHQVIRRGDDKVSNREASIFELPLYSAVLSARANDPKIGTTHRSDEKPNGFQHTDGRSNSMNLLSPEKVRGWKIEQLVKVGKVETASKGEAQSKSNSAPPQSRGPVGPPLEPAPEARPSEAAVSSVQQPTKAAATKVVTADVRQALDVEVSWKWDAREQLRTQPMREWLGEVFGYACDDRIGCDIVSNAIATAARRDPPRDFPIKGPLQNFGHEGLIECCSWAIDKIRDPKTRVPRYKGSPAGYLAHMMADQAHVDGYLDNLERRRKREQKDASKAYEECQETLRQHKRKPTEDTYDLLAVRVLSVPEGDPMRKEAEALLEQGRPK